MQTHNLIYLGKRLSEFVVGSEGNISQRTQIGFTIKASGKTLRNMSNGSFVDCNLDGISTGNQEAIPSMEASFHSWIYKNSDYDIIAHTHPKNVLKILCSDFIDEFAYTRLFPDQVVFNGPVSCVVRYATPGVALTNAIAQATADFIKLYSHFPKLFLLQNHGIICCTKSVNDAIAMTEICEKSAEIFLGCQAIGIPKFLSKEEIIQLQNHDGEIYRQKQV